MMNKPTDEELKEQSRLAYDRFREKYNKLRGGGDSLFEIPVELPIPKSLDDYKKLSGFIQQALDFAWTFGEFFLSALPANRPKMAANAAARDYAGMRLINSLIGKSLARGDFNLFDLVSTETPSIHVQMANKALERYVQFGDVALGFDWPLDLGQMFRVPPDEFANRCWQYMDITPQQAVISNQAEQRRDASAMRAELLRLESHLKELQAVPPASEYVWIKTAELAKLVARDASGLTKLLKSRPSVRSEKLGGSAGTRWNCRDLIALFIEEAWGPLAEKRLSGFVQSTMECLSQPD